VFCLGSTVALERLQIQGAALDGFAGDGGCSARISDLGVRDVGSDGIGMLRGGHLIARRISIANAGKNGVSIQQATACDLADITIDGAEMSALAIADTASA